MVDHTPSLESILVIIPTYNEAPNIETIIGRLRAAVPAAHVLVADDNSPDGTGAIADRLAASDDHVHVMHRKGKEGLGAAYLAGFAWALDAGYEVIVEMDADGSHQPEQLPLLLDALATADMVKGSRYVKGGSVVNWPAHRKFISRGGSVYSRLVLGVPVNDMTGGFTAFRASTLRAIGLDQIASAGYCFQIDLVRRAHAKDLVIKEVPIEFVERELGVSKMDQSIVSEALYRTTAWGVQHRAQQVWGLKDKVLKPGDAKKVASDARDKVQPTVDKVIHVAGDARHKVADAAEDAREKVEPVVKKVVHAAEDAIDKVQPSVDKVVEAVKPTVDKVVDHLPPKVAEKIHPAAPRRGADDES